MTTSSLVGELIYDNAYRAGYNQFRRRIMIGAIEVTINPTEPMVLLEDMWPTMMIMGAMMITLHTWTPPVAAKTLVLEVPKMGQNKCIGEDNLEKPRGEN